MINFLHGKLVEAQPGMVIVDVNGVGYEALIPLSSFDKLPAAGGEVKLLTHLAIRDDAHVLYGFMSAAEREMFRLLVHTVSGIGPKIALSILSGMNITALRGAVSAGDVKSLSQISGVGKKTAERIVLELKDKLDDLQGFASSTSPAHPHLGAVADDALSALINLGYPRPIAQKAVETAIAKDPTAKASFETLFRAAMSHIR